MDLDEMDPTQTTMIELRDAIAAQQVSATDAVGAYLDRIDQHNDTLHAYREVYHDRAMERATAVDHGEVSGPLAGVPIALKDVVCTSYGKTTCSSRMLEHFEAPFSATAVQRLEDAGAIILGKTNMDEFAMGSSCEHCAWGTVRNPWDTSRVPGGSSGGSAAAMAADLCAAAIGSDTGGSIRQPAAYTGVVGLKPTYGRISRWGLVAFASSLDQIGPFTRTVADAALLLHIMSGHDPLDSTSLNLPPSAPLTRRDDLAGLRIGIAKQYVSDANDEGVNATTSRAIALLQDAGAEIVDVDLPHTEYGVPAYYLVATAEASSNLARYDGVHYGHRTARAAPRDVNQIEFLYSQSRAEGFGDEVKLRIMLGTYALSSGYYDAYYLRAAKARRLIRQDFDAAFERCDVIACPTTPSPAFAIGKLSDDPLQMYLQDVYTVPASLAGLPAMSLPSGVVDGLPVGLQLIGPPCGEGKILEIADVAEARLGATDRPAI